MTNTASDGSPSNQKFMGIALMISGTLVFLTLDSFAKELGTRIPFLEMVWARYFFNFLTIFLIFGPRKIPTLLKTKNLKLNLVRGFLLLGGTLTFFGAVIHIPIGTATSIGFVWPLLVTALSVPFLGEKVGLPRWSAVIAGFIGALIIIQPTGGIDHWAIFLPLVMACFYSMYQIMTRMIDKNESPMTGVLYSAIIGTIVLGFALPFIWVMPDMMTLLGLATMGVLATIGHFLVIKALQTTPASLLAPFAYVQVIASIFVSWLYFGDEPETHMIGGAALIIAAGIFVIYRERNKAHVEPLDV